MIFPPIDVWRCVFFLAFVFVCIALVFAVIGYRRARHAADEGASTRADGSNEAFSRSLIDALADGIFVAQAHRFVFANAALPRMLGYAHGEFVGLPFEVVVAPQYLALWNQRFDQRIGPGPEPVKSYVLQFLAKGGAQAIDVELIATRATFEGRPAVLGMVRDVAERKRVEAELEAHRDHLEELVAERTRDLREAFMQRAETDNFARTISDNQPTLLAYIDKDLRVQFANRAILKWFGNTREEVLGRPVSELLTGHGIDFNEEFIDRVLAGETVERHMQMLDAEGVQGEFLTYRLPDVGEEGTKGYYFIAIDVTAVRQSEARLAEVNEALQKANESLQATNEALVRSRDEAEQATRAKSAFLANMSHEIRTPMNAILGLTHLVRRHLPPGENSERLGRISESASHLLGLIDGILDLSKIESGRFELEASDFAFDEMLSRAFGLVTESARDKGIELVIDSDHVPQPLRGDVTRLAQALVNLLGNAVKFTARGAVTLVVRVTADHGERLGLRFEVHDTGPGIPPDALARLFTAFEQGDASTTRRFGGTGLGLVITRHLARLMHGDAGASSEVGTGSKFWFTVELEHGTPLPVAPALPGLDRARVLLVDDLDQARVALAVLLRSLGLRTDLASSGPAGLAMARAAAQAGDPYTLLFVDWLMPDMNGLDMVEAFRHLGLGGNAKAVILTTSPAARLLARKDELGIADILIKPVSYTALFECLQALVSGGESEPRLVEPNLVSEASLRARHAGARVLLAEDNPVNQEVAQSLLEQAGLRVDLARNGVEAVALASSEPYALILMDMQMPEMDGIEATRRLRAAPTTRRLPIIAMTANAYSDDRTACLDAGMNDFLTKPVEPSHLYDLLGKWLDAPVPE